jgi:hypothetical protein
LTVNKLPANALQHANIAGHHYSHWVVTIPPGHAFGELFNPAYWSHHHKLRQFDLVRAIAHDGAFDVTVTVRAKPAGGAVMELWPKFPKGFGSSAEAQATAEAEAARAQVVPILQNGKTAVRVDHTEATKWRVISINGAPLVSGLATEAEAQDHMEKYLASLRLRMPTEEEFAKAAEERKAAADKRAADGLNDRAPRKRPQAA